MKRIVIKDLWKRFGKLEVLRGLDLTVEPGETLVIIGRSGVGKSVLLKHILGMTKPDQGTVEVDGRCVSDLKGAALFKATLGMGMLFQGAALFDSLTVSENTAFYLRQHGDLKTGKRFPEDEIQDRVHEALAMVGLEGTQSKMPSELSGGMRKRAGLARLIVYRPEVVLYDEPTTGLDPVTAAQINELILATQRKLNSTSIVVTHDMLSALTVGDRIAMQHDGKIICSFTPDEYLEVDDPLVRSFVENSGIRGKVHK
jgi:phospholipid/cholesterol/gamma-HCH transport system ATP-binding protein